MFMHRVTRRLLWILGVVVSAAAVACAPALVEPTVDDAVWAQTRWPGVTLEHLHEGRALYVRKCAGCHLLRRPDKYRAEEWNALITKMIDDHDVELSPDERERIEGYLVFASTRAAEPEITAAEPRLSDATDSTDGTSPVLNP